MTNRTFVNLLLIVLQISQSKWICETKLLATSAFMCISCITMNQEASIHTTCLTSHYVARSKCCKNILMSNRLIFTCYYVLFFF